jgi:hypothetical protein
VSEINASWILNEDRALKALLKDITVSDSKNPARKVGVWFGQPDVEIQQQTYPYITVDLVDVDEAPERAHRNDIELWYRPEGAPDALPNKGYVTEYPIPYDLIYQVTTYARQPMHDRQIIRAIMHRMGGRSHSLYIPEDDTMRSMFVVGSRKRDSTEDGRRLFSNAYTVQVFSELLPKDIAVVEKVLEVRATFSDASFTIPTNS